MTFGSTLKSKMICSAILLVASSLVGLRAASPQQGTPFPRLLAMVEAHAFPEAGGAGITMNALSMVFASGSVSTAIKHSVDGMANVQYKPTIHYPASIEKQFKKLKKKGRLAQSVGPVQPPTIKFDAEDAPVPETTHQFADEIPEALLLSASEDQDHVIYVRIYIKPWGAHWDWTVRSFWSVRSRSESDPSAWSSERWSSEVKYSARGTNASLSQALRADLDRLAGAIDR